MATDLPNWYDVQGLEVGQWARIKPALHCCGWGAPWRGGDTSIYCLADSFLGSSSHKRARYIRWDSVLQCAACYKADQELQGRQVK